MARDLMSELLVQPKRNQTFKSASRCERYCCAVARQCADKAAGREIMTVKKNMSYAPLTSIPFLNRLTETNNSVLTNAPTPRTKPSPGLRKTSNARADYPLIVHCHLCWDWVWQRPQQFLSRLSHRHRVLFVETLAPDPNLVTPLAQT